MGDALNGLRPQRLRTKAASSLLPHWLDGYSECNSCSSRVLLEHVESANCPVAYQGLKITTSLSSVSMIFSERIPHSISSLSIPNSVALDPGQHLISRIRQRGVIRIGVNEDKLPFSFYNSSGHIVGFDIDLMMSLAEDLQVTIEFIPYESGLLIQQLEEDHFDIAVSGITPNLSLLASTRILYSRSYLDIHLALIVPDYQRKQFSDMQQISALKNIHVAVRKESIVADRISGLLPASKISEFDSVDDFFKQPEFRQQVLFTSAEGGSAWTLIYPGYAVVTPFSGHQGAPLVIAVGGEDLMLEHFISTWIKLKQTDGTIDTLFRHWIQGKTDTQKRHAGVFLTIFFLLRINSFIATRKLHCKLVLNLEMENKFI
ncbi:substrate-binding periplasmic protein [Bathymodiolus japonicus methanotrophic gill symbiont]|uniref:substrate-binding periplasmic protein n=1 Tax=Bathymodiolus japonicus methanotrophic gill symbiont TaxID=113269 RepID=UPI001C8E2FE2|nr:transporter substrate-binding domain-containing protein [Bathymodiolus japonicus methanotrophic gill symbiont]